MAACCKCKREVDKVDKKGWCNKCNNEYNRMWRKKYRLSVAREIRLLRRELGLTDPPKHCCVCGSAIKKSSPYRSYCSRECYRAAFRGYRVRYVDARTN